MSAIDSKSLASPERLSSYVQLEVGDLILPGIEVIGRAGTTETIIGRDVLNQLIVTLNGLANIAEIRD